jgi:hypothetical protein
VLQWAHAAGCPWNSEACWRAAQGGHLGALQWLHANGCPWDEATFEGAANGGHVSVMHWAIANGCPWQPYRCPSMVDEEDHLELLEWARSNGYLNDY